MLYLKKYFTEGLIQVAILLSLCGVRVDVGLEPYLLSSWQDMILGPMAALTPTQFHNLRNSLEEGQGLHPKSVDLDRFFTARRLLGWVHSLDRLQVPPAEVETWLVQREPDPLPIGRPEQMAPLERFPALLERDRPDLPVDYDVPMIGILREDQEEGEEEEKDKEEGDYHGITLDEEGEEEEEEEDDEDNLDEMLRPHRRTQGQGLEGPGGSYGNRELMQDEVEQTSSSLQECLRLLEETFPFREEQQLQNDGNGGGDQVCQPPGREGCDPPVNPPVDRELDWQDLFAIMEPENSEVDWSISLGNTNLRETGFESECNNICGSPDQKIPVQETLQQGLFWPSQSDQESILLPLIPSAELNNQSSALTTSYEKPLHSHPDYTDLLTEDPSEDSFSELNADDKLTPFYMDLQLKDQQDMVERSPIYASNPENLTSFHSQPQTPSGFVLSPEGNDETQDLLSSMFLVDSELEDSLPSPLGELLEDAAILDEITLLDLALAEEGFSPELVSRLEGDSFLDSEAALETRKDNDPADVGMAITEDQSELRRLQQDGDNDSDSGLSLDFNHSPASPCTSEASYYSSASSSSSSTGSAAGSSFSDDENENVKEGLVGSDVEMEVTIKQEMEEEELGAVGGRYLEDVVKSFPSNYGDHKIFNGFSWLENVDHDHTYNQPRPSASLSSLGKIPTKQTKSSLRHVKPKPYSCSPSGFISETKLWSRDDRRARSLKVPFSNELIVNLPVDEFNDLLANYQLSEEQLNLVRDIRRRGKNKIAAQNCRKRKLDVLLELKDDVSGLKSYRSRLVREKQEAMRKLQEMKHQLGMLYQDVFTRLRDDEGRPLDAMEYLLQYEPNGSVTVASRNQGATLTKTSKKQRDKKK